MSRFTAPAVCIVVITLLTSPALADRNKDVAAALRQRYPDATTEIVKTDTINGVKVHRVEIRDKQGQSTALITDTGDFLLSGMPGQFDKLPSTARAAQALFKAKPQDVEMYSATSYWVDMDVDGKTYRVRLDPLGRIRDIANPKEYEAADVTQYPRAGDVGSKIGDLAKKHLDEPGEVRGVYKDPQMEGFYAVLLEKDGRNQLVFLDENDNVYATRTEIDRKDLPGAVTDTLERMFDTGKIRRAFRGDVQYTQWTTSNAAGQTVTFKVRPNGDIMEVRSAAAEQEEEAVTAAAKVGPEQRNNRDRGNKDR